MSKVIIIGSINTDLVITSPQMPKAGETIVGRDFFTARGGKGANQAVAAARTGAKTIMCAAVGKDAFGADAISALESDGIDTSFVKVAEDAPTGTAVIIISDGNNRIILDKGANDKLSVTDVDKVLENIEPQDVVLVQLENPINVIGYAMKRAKELGAYVILNPAPAATDILPYLTYCDLITPNETESDLLGGTEKLLSSVPVVLTTLGENGFEIATKNDKKRYPCIKIDPVDTTAAGDTLCGSLAAKIALDDTLEDAARFGSLAASIACTKMGAQPSIPTAETVKSWNR